MEKKELLSERATPHEVADLIALLGVKERALQAEAEAVQARGIQIANDDLAGLKKDSKGLREVTDNLSSLKFKRDALAETKATLKARLQALITEDVQQRINQINEEIAAGRAEAQKLETERVRLLAQLDIMSWYLNGLRYDNHHHGLTIVEMKNLLVAERNRLREEMGPDVVSIPLRRNQLLQERSKLLSLNAEDRAAELLEQARSQLACNQ